MAEQRCYFYNAQAASSLDDARGGSRGLDLAHHLGMDHGHAIRDHVEAVLGHILGLFGRLDSNHLEEVALADPILDRHSVWAVAGRRKVLSACQSRVKAGAAGGHCSTDRQ